MYERTYHAKVLQHDKKPPKRKRFNWRRFLIIVGAIIVLVGIVLVIRVPRFQVTAVTVTGTNVAEPADVTQFVLDGLKGQYVHVFPKASIFLVSTDTVAQQIAAQYPRFKTVKVTRSNMHTLKVAVSEYPGVYLWCDSADACSFMDETGTVFADAPYFSGSAYLKLYGGERAAYPFHPVTSEQIAMLSLINDRLEAIDISPLSFSFVSEHEVSVGFMHGSAVARIMFDPSDDIETELQTLYTGLRTDPLAGLYRNPAKTLLYLDARFASKLIYKFD